MPQSTFAALQCELVSKSFRLIGLSATGNFPQSLPGLAIRVQQDLEARSSEIKHAIDTNVLISPYLANSIVTTYFACLEVTEIEDIPEGMLAMEVPSTTYAKVSCTNKTIEQGYQQIFSWIKDQGYTQASLEKFFPLEIFYIKDNGEEEIVELYIPIRN